jgi:hypothetical protein
MGKHLSYKHSAVHNFHLLQHGVSHQPTLLYVYWCSFNWCRYCFACINEWSFKDKSKSVTMECPTCGSAVRRTALARCVVLDQVIEAQLRRDGRLNNRYALEKNVLLLLPWRMQNGSVPLTTAAQQTQ